MNKMLIKHKCDLNCAQNKQICLLCKTEKSTKAFHVDSTRKTGHHPKCKECVKEFGTGYYKINKERVKRNSTTRLKQIRIKNQLHNCITEKCNLILRTCTKCLIEFNLQFFTIDRGFDNSHDSVCRICTYKRGALKRNIVWKLTDEQTLKLIIEPCYYCGIKFDYKTNGIDRVNNKLPYEPDNVVTCCKKCNLAKGGLTLELFLRATAEIADRNNRIATLYKEGKFDAWLLDK